MFAYFLPEILILLAIMSHIQKEIMTGVLFLKEQAIEDIQTAINRYVTDLTLSLNLYSLNTTQTSSTRK
jgi:hypothetical protein